MLRLEGASKAYTKRDSSVIALHPATLEIAAGDFVAVVGPSGSGKTTLLSILGGMLAPSSGHVWLDGRPLYEIPVKSRTELRRSRIGFVFQNFNLIPYLSALENVQVPLFLAGVSANDQRRRAGTLLERVGLADRASHRPSELSVGQQQRVAVARMLANDPAVVLADEPTGNLDPETRDLVLGLFDGFHAEGRTVVLVTHDPAVAARAQRFLRIVSGKVAMVSNSREIFDAA